MVGRSIVPVGVCLLAFGCTLDSRVIAGRPGIDAGADGGLVARDGGRWDGARPLDAGGLDGGPPDGGRPDGGPAPGCAALDLDTVALYTFDSDPPALMLDAAGLHHGAYVAWPASVDGPPGCGRGIAFPAAASDVRGIVLHSPALDLGSGSIDFWIRFGSLPAGPMGVISRDAERSVLSGHFTVYASAMHHFAVRIQSSAESAWVCTEPGSIVAGRWMHVAFVFGPPRIELYLDGVRATYTGDDGIFGGARCGSDAALGISGNANPWVIGASTDASFEGLADPTRWPLRDAAIDHVRISRVRRDFSRP